MLLIVFSSFPEVDPIGVMLEFSSVPCASMVSSNGVIFTFFCISSCCTLKFWVDLGGDLLDVSSITFTGLIVPVVAFVGTSITNRSSMLIISHFSANLEITSF